MSTVYLLMRHPQHPFSEGHLKAGECVSVFANKTEAERIAAEKNARKPYYLWTVQAKRMKS